MDVHKGEKRHFPTPLEIAIKDQNFLGNLKSVVPGPQPTDIFGGAK